MKMGAQINPIHKQEKQKLALPWYLQEYHMFLHDGLHMAQVLAF